MVHLWFFFWAPFVEPHQNRHTPLSPHKPLLSPTPNVFHPYCGIFVIISSTSFPCDTHAIPLQFVWTGLVWQQQKTCNSQYRPFVCPFFCSSPTPRPRVPPFYLHGMIIWSHDPPRRHDWTTLSTNLCLQNKKTTNPLFSPKQCTFRSTTCAPKNMKIPSQGECPRSLKLKVKLSPL